ncbi:MAG: homoserine kinase [Candidatus Sericytochromatia bacterium]
MSPKPVRVRVPATTANLGPGYDLLGAALSLWNHFEFRPAERLSLEMQGRRASECHFYLDQDSLIWQAFARVYALCDRVPPAFALVQEVDVPPARGLGSSSTAIVAGLLAANTWLDQPLDRSSLLALATEIEGHPDNVAPALLGGCILNLPPVSDAHPRWTSLPVPTRLHWVVCIPAFELATSAARAVVPQVLPLSDAIANLGYLGALVSGLCLDKPELIAQGLEDRLHQPYRRQLVPGMPEVMAAARGAGALGCVLSGAGPTLLALTLDDPAALGQAMVACWQKYGVVAESVSCVIDPQGAVCLD